MISIITLNLSFFLDCRKTYIAYTLQQNVHPNQDRNREDISLFRSWFGTNLRKLFDWGSEVLSQVYRISELVINHLCLDSHLKYFLVLKVVTATFLRVHNKTLNCLKPVFHYSFFFILLYSLLKLQIECIKFRLAKKLRLLYFLTLTPNSSVETPSSEFLQYVPFPHIFRWSRIQIYWTLSFDTDHHVYVILLTIWSFAIPNGS